VRRGEGEKGRMGEGEKGSQGENEKVFRRKSISIKRQNNPVEPVFRRKLTIIC
jgi:hypothetical protein